MNAPLVFGRLFIGTREGRRSECPLPPSPRSPWRGTRLGLLLCPSASLFFIFGPLPRQWRRWAQDAPTPPRRARHASEVEVKGRSYDADGGDGGPRFYAARGSPDQGGRAGPPRVFAQTPLRVVQGEEPSARFYVFSREEGDPLARRRCFTTERPGLDVTALPSLS